MVHHGKMIGSAVGSGRNAFLDFILDGSQSQPCGILSE
jgi:hypothetical protein